MKTPPVERRSRAPRPPRPTFAPAFKGQTPFFGHVAMAMRSLTGVRVITVDGAAWRKLDTLRPEIVILSMTIDRFLISRPFKELGLKVYRPPLNIGMLYIMGEPENLALIEKINPHDNLRLAIRKHSSLIDDKHNS